MWSLTKAFLAGAPFVIAGVGVIGLVVYGLKTYPLTSVGICAGLISIAISVGLGSAIIGED